MVRASSLLITLFSIICPQINCQPGGGPGQGQGTDGGGDTNTGSTPQTCSIYGYDSSYTESIQGDLRIIRTNGCPNHYAECLNKPESICPTDEPITEASVINQTLNIPAYPCINDYVDDSSYNWTGYPVYCLLNSLGVALNGVSLFSPSANQQCKDAIGEESASFDYCGGHAGPGGLYHYHVGPPCLLDQLNDSDTVNPNGHSPQIGWAFDGFPVYGPHGLNGEYIELCSQNTSNATDCLDNCSGHMQHTIDGFKYHYHVAGPVGDLVTNPINPTPSPDRWPYTFGCYRGIPSDWSQIAISGAAPELNCVESGVTDDYVAMAVEGVTELYDSGELPSTTTLPTNPGGEEDLSTTSIEDSLSSPSGEEEISASIIQPTKESSASVYNLLFVSISLITIVAYQ